MSGLINYVTTCVRDAFTGENEQVATLILADEDFFAHICTCLKDEYGTKDAIADAVTRVAADFDAETDDFGDNNLRDWLINTASSPTGWFKNRLGI